MKRVLVGLILAGLAVASSACSSSGSSGNERAAGAAGRADTFGAALTGRQRGTNRRIPAV